jgi:peptidoglycan/xylan/chitin deacetylase (PgdA/CDA1 family)
MLPAWSRNAVLNGVWHSGALTIMRPFCVDRLVVLRYHSICVDNEEPEYVARSITLPVTMFDRQMRLVSEHYRCLSLDEAVFCLTNDRPLPPRSIVITFDDGYQDNYQYAFPILVKYRLPATIYLVSSTITEGRVLWTSRLRQALAASRVPNLVLPDLHPVPFSLGDETSRATSARLLTNVLNTMSQRTRWVWIDRIVEETQAPPAPWAGKWFLTLDQINEMKGQGISFGAHTVTHPNLPGLDPSEARSEVEQARGDLQQALGTEIAHFSYPNSGALHPHVSDLVVRFVREAGYTSAVTSHEGPCRPRSEVFRMPRIGINRARSSLPRFGMLLEATRLARNANVAAANG